MFVKNEMPYWHLFSFIQPYFVARLFLPQANLFPGLASHGLSKLHFTLTKGDASKLAKPMYRFWEYKFTAIHNLMSLLNGVGCGDFEINLSSIIANIYQPFNTISSVTH